MATVIQWLTTALTVLILADVLVSFLLSPFHPVRRTLDSMVHPLLAPIRSFLPPIGMLDFSPFVLLILVQVLGALLIQFLGSG
jgi:YggT family protein